MCSEAAAEVARSSDGLSAELAERKPVAAKELRWVLRAPELIVDRYTGRSYLFDHHDAADLCEVLNHYEAQVEVLRAM